MTISDFQSGTCALEIRRLDDAASPVEAWSRLPEEGTGVVALSDRIVRFDPGRRDGLPVEAEVHHGPSTTILRMDGAAWRAWRWTEKAGDTHRWVERVYRSSEPGEHPPHLVYRQYWTLRDDDGIRVWKPLGARFCGFKEAER